MLIRAAPLIRQKMQQDKVWMQGAKGQSHTCFRVVCQLPLVVEENAVPPQMLKQDPRASWVDFWELNFGILVLTTNRKAQIRSGLWREWEYLTECSGRASLLSLPYGAVLYNKPKCESAVWCGCKDSECIVRCHEEKYSIQIEEGINTILFYFG